MSGFVYFITTGEAERVKIGFTRNHPSVRLRELQTGSPFELCILATERGSVDYERKLHARFERYRLHGEWFALVDEVRDHIREANAREYELAVAEGLHPPYWARVGEAVRNGAQAEELATV